MSFEVAAEAYAAFMGRYADPLAVELLRLLPLAPGARALDVGCGPGTVTALLAGALGADHVVAADPSAPFVEAARARCPGVDIRLAPAERLPFPDASVAVAVAQLVVNFMTDPVAGLREMARVTRPGGTVAVSVWDLAGGRAPLAPFWRGVQSLSAVPVSGEADVPGAREGDLERLLDEAGLTEVRGTEITVVRRHPTFADWWEPYTLGVGPAGDHVAGLLPEEREELAGACRALLPEPPFDIEATAWVAVGIARHP